MHPKTELKKWIGRAFSTDFLEKLTEYSIWRNHALLDAVPVRPEGRERLWQDAVIQIGAERDFLFLEFGVWRGESMREFARLVQSPDSILYGFDSFEGLPESWRGMESGHFATDGSMPRIEDDRVTFVKGWFRDTLPGMMGALAEQAEDRAVLVHFDADLYSSTLFLLFTLATRIRSYHFVFDEFSGHESRALYNFVQATGAEVEYLGQTTWQDCPSAVFGRLTLDIDFR